MTTVMPPMVHLVDDEAPVRDALAFLFHSHGLPVRAYASGPELLAALDGNAGTPGPSALSLQEGARPFGRPGGAHALRGCIVLDVRMEPLSGLQVFDELLARGVALPVIFLTGHGDIPMAVDALKRGAFDFVEKPFSDAALAERVERAMAREAALAAEAGDHARVSAMIDSLTDREREVMHRVAAGKLNKVIADELAIAMRTVEVHRARVFAKLGVRSSAELATMLERWKRA